MIQQDTWQLLATQILFWRPRPFAISWTISPPVAHSKSYGYQAAQRLCGGSETEHNIWGELFWSSLCCLRVLNNKELSTSNNYKRISYTSWKYNMFPVPGSVICMLLWDLRPPYGLPFECNLQHFRATTFDLHPISSIWKPYAAYIRPMCSPHRSI